MKRLLLLALVACDAQPSKLDAISVTKPTVSAEAPLVFDADMIDAWVGAQVAKRGVVGAALVVVKDGKTVLARGYGKKRVDAADPVDADTPFALGSISKQFTCAAAYVLADQGKLAMTEPVSKYFPQLGGDATLADLGGHTSGYRDYYPLDYVDARMREPIAPDDLIADYAPHKDFKAGTRNTYSNTGYVMLARVVEMVGGRPYGEALRAGIFEPLGMTTASTVRPANAASGHVSFLVDEPSVAPLEAEGWLFGIGDIWASANDLARWDVAFAEGKILSDDARKAMGTARTLDDGRSTGYGCGLGVRQIAGETVLTHSGWVGGFYTFNAFVPRTKSAVVLLTNDQHVSLGDVHERIVRLVTEDVSAVPAIATPAAEAVRTLIVQIQDGQIDRATLGDDLAGYFDDPRFARSAAKLRALGAPTVKLKSRRERGALEVTAFDVSFANGKSYEASMYRSPDGKIRQLLFMF